MATTITPLDMDSAYKIIRDADVDATAERNTNDGPAVIYGLVIDNSANAAASYIKFFDADPVTVGTTAPDMILMIPASVSRTVISKKGIDFATALTFSADVAGGTAGTTGPTSNVIMDVIVG